MKEAIGAASIMLEKPAKEVTTGEIALWENGYLMGVRNTLQEVVDDINRDTEVPELIKEDTEPFPLFAEQSIKEHEEKMARTEEKERMADYSDQKRRSL